VTTADDIIRIGDKLSWSIGYFREYGYVAYVLPAAFEVTNRYGHREVVPAGLCTKECP
jgi:hypothetical protein